MALLWYRDDVDGLLKPFAIPGDDLSSSSVAVAGQVVGPGRDWTAVGAATSPPSGDHPSAFRLGGWVCPTFGTWMLELHAAGAEDVGVGALIEGLGTDRGSESVGVGVGVAWLFEGEEGSEFHFFVRHEDVGAQALNVRVSATRLRSFSPGEAGSREVSEWVLRAGDTMEGVLRLAVDPIDPMDAATKEFVDGKVVNSWGGGATDRAPSQAAAQAAVEDLSARVVEAGGGLIGGGRIDGDPRLEVGAGGGISVSGDSVGLDFQTLDDRWATREAAQVTDWNSAIRNGWYMGANAANAPSSTKAGWWYGKVTRHNDLWVTQELRPFAQAGIDQNAVLVRHMRSGGWGAWSRQVNFGALSWDMLDNFLMIRHGDGVTLWAIGNKKDVRTGGVADGEQFRIQRYDTAGNYSGNVMTANMAGVVSFPSGHARAMEAMDGGAEVAADVVATVGVVARMLTSALVRLGVVPEAKAAAVLGLVLGEASDEYDPTSADGVLG